MIVCDKCGAPATNQAVDILRDESGMKDSFVKFSPIGGVKNGCDEHPVHSEQHVSSWPSFRLPLDDETR